MSTQERRGRGRGRFFAIARQEYFLMMMTDNPTG